MAKYDKICFIIKKSWILTTKITALPFRVAIPLAIGISNSYVNRRIENSLAFCILRKCCIHDLFESELWQFPFSI